MLSAPYLNREESICLITHRAGSGKNLLPTDSLRLLPAHVRPRQRTTAAHPFPQRHRSAPPARPSLAPCPQVRRQLVVCPPGRRSRPCAPAAAHPPLARSPPAPLPAGPAAARCPPAARAPTPSGCSSPATARSHIGVEAAREGEPAVLRATGAWRTSVLSWEVEPRMKRFQTIYLASESGWKRERQGVEARAAGFSERNQTCP